MDSEHLSGVRLLLIAVAVIAVFYVVATVVLLLAGVHTLGTPR